MYWLRSRQRHSGNVQVIVRKDHRMRLSFLREQLIRSSEQLVLVDTKKRGFLGPASVRKHLVEVLCSNNHNEVKCTSSTVNPFSQHHRYWYPPYSAISKEYVTKWHNIFRRSASAFSQIYWLEFLFNFVNFCRSYARKQKCMFWWATLYINIH